MNAGYGNLLSLKYSMGMENVRFTIISLMEDMLAKVTLPDSNQKELPMRQSAERLYQRFSTLLIESYPKPKELVRRSSFDILKLSCKSCETDQREDNNGRITEAVMADVRTALLHTDYSIKEISSRLGFNNLAFFGKYEKKHSDLPPTQLRTYSNLKN